MCALKILIVKTLLEVTFVLVSLVLSKMQRSVRVRQKCEKVNELQKKRFFMSYIHILVNLCNIRKYWFSFIKVFNHHKWLPQIGYYQLQLIIRTVNFVKSNRSFPIDKYIGKWRFCSNPIMRWMFRFLSRSNGLTIWTAIKLTIKNINDIRKELRQSTKHSPTIVCLKAIALQRSWSFLLS